VEAKENIVEVNQEKIKIIVELVRSNSAHGKFTLHNDLITEPISVNENNLCEVIDSIKASTEYTDIVELQGEKLKYLYSKKEMTETYAKMLFRVEEKDLLNLIVETVRHESKTYPRPTAVGIFFDHPFNFDENTFKAIYKQIKQNKNYEDLHETTASNDALYLYSTDYLTKDHAQALTEWIEVEQYKTP
jgi:hypothetical protein